MKRMAALLLAVAMCLSISTFGEEDLIGSWECVATVLNGVLTEKEENEKELWAFRPDGTWQLYDGNVIDYTFTEDKITISYDDSFSKLIGYENRVLTKEYSYILNDDVLVLIYTVNGSSTYMVHQRESGEGLFGRWNQVAWLYNEEDYKAWQNTSTLTEELVDEFIDFCTDGKCVFWQACYPAYDDWVEIPDLTFRYAVSGEKLTLSMGNDVYDVGYTFEDGQLVLTFTDSYLDDGDWVNREEKVFLSRVQ